ncbi:pyridoxamine 5'-phosphate oxidase family protein [Paracoccus sp. p4-l81]|uniref:pyridoxamine 5'-phosphate oxidase family protein n=1 Tax=Paracoccus sp. p4-l81 TaxID=3342806 RepID=UPI0035B9DABB
MILTDALRHDLRDAVLCWVATADATGQPNVSPKEIFALTADDRLVIADIASPVTVSNLRQNPRLCVSLIDVFRQKGWKLTGSATLIDRDAPGFGETGAEVLALAGRDFPVRRLIVMTPDRAVPILAPSYRVFPDRTEANQIARAHARYGVRPA